MNPGGSISWAVLPLIWWNTAAAVANATLHNLGYVGGLVFALNFPREPRSGWRERAQSVAPLLFVVLSAMSLAAIAMRAWGGSTELLSRSQWTLQVAINVVALYALNLLPINYAGAGLVLLGAVLMGVEAHIGAFGAIGIGGIVAFVIGSIMMFPSVPGFELSPWTIAEAVVVTAGLFLFVLGMLFRSHREVVIAGMRALLGAEGEALSWQGLHGRIQIKGETWRARAAAPLRPGTRVKVIDRDGLVLVVTPA